MDESKKFALLFAQMFSKGGGGGDLSAYQKKRITAVIPDLTATTVEGAIAEIIEKLGNLDKPYASLKRRSRYLYEASYISIPEYVELNTAPALCSSVVSNGKLYRVLDWKYDNTASFHVLCPNFEGTAFLSGLTDTELSDELVGQLPYHVTDGRNENGIMVAAHVLYNDWSWSGTGNTPLTMLPYIVLSRVKSMETMESDLSGVLDDLHTTPAMDAAEYLLQVLVTDGVTTCVLCPDTENIGEYKIVDITENPKLTNFLWVPDAVVDRANLQTRPTGVERFNGMTTDLAELRFTKAYEAPTRLSEFIGIDGTDKDSSDEELEAIYDVAHAEYLVRERDGDLWQSMLSVVYSQDGIENLWVQEDWTHDYAVTGAIKELESSKLDIFQGVAFAGKFLYIGADGKITLTDAPSGGGTEGVVAGAYDATVTYSAKDLCIHEDLLYRAKQDISTPEEWTAAHWQQTTVADELKDYYRYLDWTVTLTDANNLQPTGLTLTCYDENDEIHQQKAYNGQPVTFDRLQIGKHYSVVPSGTWTGHFNPTPATVEGYATVDASFTIVYSTIDSLETFTDLKAALDAGAFDAIPLGQVVSFTHATEGIIDWEVVDKDETDESVTLLMANPFTSNMVFDDVEALYYAENGLIAGDYCFTHSSKVYYFHINTAIPTGGQLRATTSAFTTYATPEDTTALESGTVSETAISGATSLGTTAAGDLNHMDRVSYGNNNYLYSNLAQWLNSSGAANSWYQHQHRFDRPPSYRTKPGFLAGVPAADLACVADTVVKCATNTTWEDPEGQYPKNTAYTVTQKFFLPSRKEIFGDSDGKDDGSTIFDLYVGATNPDRIKYTRGTTSARFWWLRSPGPVDAGVERVVGTSGAVGGYSADGGNVGAAAACKIKKSV